MPNPKILAFYLPQYHTIPENDLWWGKGFTEWTNVKASNPQFRWHIQPEIPLHNNYYDLSDPRVMEDQARLAKTYKIDGFVYYHYWFHGKKLLEKPIENMLSNPDIDINFCLCWANETWSRTWSGAEKQILIKQNYDETFEECSEHFYYLLNFFKDKRYLKVHNRPIIIIYKPQLICNLDEMMSWWNQLAREAGFAGLLWGFQHESSFTQLSRLIDFDFGINFEPFYTVQQELQENLLIKKIKGAVRRVLNKPKVYDYDTIWEHILARKTITENITIFQSAFPSWDNTPRRQNHSIIFKGASPKKFQEYFLELYRKCNNDLFLFINAWNEWAEGAHLEPDKRNGYGYLEAVKAAVESIN